MGCFRIRFAGLVSIILMASGCVGAGTVTGNRLHVLTNPDEHGYGFCPLRSPKAITNCSMAQAKTITPEKLFALWGPPKSDKIVNGYREIVYNRDLKWRGAVIFVIIPIPLLVPVGHNEFTFLYKEDEPVSVQYNDNLGGKSTGCGFFSERPGGFDCM